MGHRVLPLCYMRAAGDRTVVGVAAVTALDRTRAQAEDDHRVAEVAARAFQWETGILVGFYSLPPLPLWHGD
jgi:hypothetical protein